MIASSLYLLLVLTWTRPCPGAGRNNEDRYDFDISMDEKVSVKTSTKIDAEIALPAIPNLAMEHMGERQAFAIVGVRNPLLQISDDIRSNRILYGGVGGRLDASDALHI